MNDPPLPPGVTVAPPPPELKLGEEDNPRRLWRISDPDDDNYRHDPLAEATAFPDKTETDTPDALRAKPFACSGSINSTRYQEASRFRAMPDMTWPEARVALNRLAWPVASYYWRDRATSPDYVALAEFALTAHGFTGFAGLRGEHAVKLREGLHHVLRVQLYERLQRTLHSAGGLMPRRLPGRLQTGCRAKAGAAIALCGGWCRPQPTIGCRSMRVHPIRQ
jgi:hypothetical protein